MFGPENYKGDGTGTSTYMDIDTGDIIVVHDDGSGRGWKAKI